MLLSFPEYLNQNLEANKIVKESVDFLLSIQKADGAIKNFYSAIFLTC